MLMAKKPKPVGGPNPWPERLKALRKRLKITQAEAARRADIPLRTWISWENDHRRPSRAMQRLLPQIFPELAT